VPTARTIVLVALVAAAAAAPPARSPALAQAASCADFDAYEWAQSVYDSDPDGYAALDPDGDGIACPELPAGGAAPALWADRIPARAAPATLVDVVDGDTIEIRTREGDTETVRLIGVDTPETRDPRRPVQCFGAEATRFTSLMLSLVPDGTVYVERDVSDRDRFGRLLRYVWLEIDGQPYLLNEAIARSGFGDSSAYPPDVKHQDRIDDGERFAREYGLGLWQACGGPDVPLAEAQPAAADPAPAPEPQIPAPVTQPEAPLPAPAPEPPPAPPAGCDPSYPTLCLPSFPDIDCGEIGARQFPVLPPDPHGFDGDFDGVGCESG